MTPDDELREEARKRIVAKREFWQHLVAYVIINAGLIGIWFATGTDYFWPGWVLLGWGVGLAFHAWTTFGQQPIDESAIQREIDRMRRKQGP
ncbi:MAG: 2TM domain-containing protein [Actinomycetota bacterium]